MDTTEIKKNFHLLIDSIENEKLLIDFYELIKKRSSSVEGQLWDKMTSEEQEELLLTLEECKDPQNTVRHEEVEKKYRKWL